MQPGVTTVDLNQAILAEGGSEKLTIDGVHLNSTGHGILARELEKHLQSLLISAERGKDEVLSALPN